MFKKILSVGLAAIMIMGMGLTTYAANPNNETAISESIVYAEITNGEIQPYSRNSIIVMTELQANELSTKVVEIAKTSEMVYITGDVDLSNLADTCGIEMTTQSENMNAENNPTIGVALDYIDGEILLNEVTLLASNAQAVLSSRSNNLTVDGIEAALATDVSPLTAPADKPTLYLPDGFDHRATKSSVVYDNNNKNVGSMSFTAYFFEKGYWTDGYMFDTVCRSTFAPKSGYKCTKFYVSLGHTSSSLANHEIIDQTRIGGNGTSTTHSLELSGSADGIEGGGSTSWSYDVDAQDVTNSFNSSDEKTWCFEPVKGRDGDAWIEEPGIRSVSSSSKCYTSISLRCPFTTIFDIVLEENSLDWNITFNYGA